MANYRMMPPSSGPRLVTTVNGRTYTGVAGTPQDVPESDRNPLNANGWLLMGMVGTTALRPAQPSYPAVLFYIDTTVNKPIWYDGATWRDYAGTSA